MSCFSKKIFAFLALFAVNIFKTKNPAQMNGVFISKGERESVNRINADVLTISAFSLKLNNTAC